MTDARGAQADPVAIKATVTAAFTHDAAVAPPSPSPSPAAGAGYTM
jgi:hypothetical protein